MLVVVSPAKNLDYDSKLPSFINNKAEIHTSEPALIDDTKKLSQVCKKLAPSQLSSLMSISDKLAILNAQRFSSFEFPFTDNNSRPSLYAFNGDVYTGLDAQSLDEESVEYAQQHLRILSGLYGVLKPLDLMQPYRLEMGTKLAVGKAKNLYEYWQDKITKELNKAVEAQGDNVVINLASKEYFSSVMPDKLNAMIVTPHFKDEKNGKYKIISFFAKKARGLMARYIIENKVSDIKSLQKFNVDGYYFVPEESSQTDLVFKRKEKQ